MAERQARPRVLCLSTYPIEDASVRQRLLAFADSMGRAGWTVDFDSVMSSRLFAIKNRRGLPASLERVARLVAGLLRRVAVLASAGRYEAVWIHREAFPFFTPWPERVLRRVVRGRIVFDFDDALYERPPRGRDWRSRLRRPERFADSLRCADIVLAGSPVLVRWAAEQGIDARLVPTCVDTASVRPAVREAPVPVTVGWIGSWSTYRDLRAVAGVLGRVGEMPGVRLLLVGAANLAAIRHEVPSAEWKPWALDRESDDLREFDIGIMPLPDTPWNRGKCAFKLIQYMALGIPFVASPVGLNVEVAAASGGGILCSTDDEWLEAIGRLVVDGSLRARLGAAGRRHAIDCYDYRIHAAEILAALGPGTRAP